MQNLWARVAQVRSTCNCSLCASPRNALTQRVTAPPARRGIRQGDFFFVFSSTLAFEAAVIDSVRKDARSKHWDNIIAEGREQVDAVEADQKRRIDALLDSAERAKRAGQHTESENYGDAWRIAAGPKQLDWSWEGVFQWASKCNESRAASGFQDWKGPPLGLLRSLTARDLQELLSDKRILRRFYGGSDCAELVPDPQGRTLSTKKQRTLEWSMTKLVLKILWTFCGEESYKLMTGVPTEDLARIVPLDAASSFDGWNANLNRINDKLDTLYSHTMRSDIYDRFERPCTPRYDFEKECGQDEMIHLNASLSSMLQELSVGGKFSSLLAKICQQLLLSRTPPNVHTYNVLLVRFCQLEEVDLVHFVLESMWESHIRPNEITHATVLRFFTVTGNKQEFSLYVKRMRGLKGGLALADSTTPLHPLIENRFHVFGTGLRKIAQKARMNQEVYSALIVGLLRFFDPEDAMYWYRAMIGEGWKPSMEVLIAILRDCCERADWNAGLAVWKQFSKEALKLRMVAYEWMLRLCQRCQQHNAHSTILDDGVRKGILTARMRELPTAEIPENVGAFQTRAHKKSRIDTTRGMQDLSAATQNRLEQIKQFANVDGSLLLGNALSGVSMTDEAVNAKLRDLEEEATRAKRAKDAIAHCEKSLIKLRDDIAGTDEEINTYLPTLMRIRNLGKLGKAMIAPQNSALLSRLSVKLREMPSEDPPAVVQSVYKIYRQKVLSGKAESEQRMRASKSHTTLWGPQGRPHWSGPGQMEGTGFRRLPAPIEWPTQPHLIEDVEAPLQAHA